jgi:hypothetical protein
LNLNFSARWIGFKQLISLAASSLFPLFIRFVFISDEQELIFKQLVKFYKLIFFAMFLSFLSSHIRQDQFLKDFYTLVYLKDFIVLKKEL